MESCHHRWRLPDRGAGPGWATALNPHRGFQVPAQTIQNAMWPHRCIWTAEAAQLGPLLPVKFDQAQSGFRRIRRGRSRHCCNESRRMVVGEGNPVSPGALGRV